MAGGGGDGGGGGASDWPKVVMDSSELRTGKAISYLLNKFFVKR